MYSLFIHKTYQTINVHCTYMISWNWAFIGASKELLDNVISLMQVLIECSFCNEGLPMGCVCCPTTGILSMCDLWNKTRCWPSELRSVTVNFLIWWKHYGLVCHAIKPEVISNDMFFYTTSRFSTSQFTIQIGNLLYWDLDKTWLSCWCMVQKVLWLFVNAIK